MRQRYGGAQVMVVALAVLAALAVVVALSADAAEAQVDEPADLGSPLGKVVQIAEGVPVDVTRDSGVDIGAVCGKVIFSFVATQANTSIITTDDEAGYSLYTVDGPIEADNAVLAVDRCGGETWRQFGFHAQQDNVTLTPGERYWVSWFQEDNTEKVAINGLGLLEFAGPLFQNGEYIYTRDTGPDTSVGECTQAIVGSFVADGPETEIWVNDWEQYYGLYVDESNAVHPTVDDLTEVLPCRGGLSAYIDLGENPGYSATVATEPGRTYYLGWHIEDNEDRFMLNPVNPLRRVLDEVPVLVEGQELQFVEGDGIDFDVDGVCGRLAARFTPTHRFNRIFTTDDENGFNLYTVPEPREGFSEAPDLYRDRCGSDNWVQHTNPNGAGTWSQELILEPGVTYWVTWRQEDVTETFVIDANNHLGPVSELPRDVEVEQPREGFGPIAESTTCVHEIIGSFVADDDSFDIWAADNEQNFSLYVNNSALVDPRSTDLTVATPCLGSASWEPLEVGGYHTVVSTVPGVRYYLGWYQEDFQERLEFDTSDPLRLPPAAMPVVSCLAGRGRVDLNLTNPTLTAASYRLEFQGLSPRVTTVVPGGAGRMSLTGRPPGTYTVNVTRNGEPLLDTTVDIDCAQPSAGDPEVRVLSTCLNGSGLIRFQFVNPTAQARSYLIQVDGVPNRSTTAAPFGQALRGTSGRPSGFHQARIFGPGNVLIADPLVRVNCGPY